MDIYELLTKILVLLTSIAWICCPTVILGGLMVFVFFAFFRVSQRPQNRAWKELAANTGLNFIPGTYTRRPSLSGSFRERGTHLYIVRRGTVQRRRRSYTVISIEVDTPADVFLSVSSEDFLSEITKSMGMQDIQIDDREFDKRFVIKSHPKKFGDELFKEAGLRKHLLQAQYAYFVLKEGQLIYEKMLIDNDTENLLFLLDLMNHLAEACERTTKEFA